MFGAVYGSKRPFTVASPKWNSSEANPESDRVLGKFPRHDAFTKTVRHQTTSFRCCDQRRPNREGFRRRAEYMFNFVLYQQKFDSRLSAL